MLLSSKMFFFVEKKSYFQIVALLSLQEIISLPLFLVNLSRVPMGVFVYLTLNREKERERYPVFGNNMKCP